MILVLDSGTRAPKSAGETCTQQVLSKRPRWFGCPLSSNPSIPSPEPLLPLQVCQNWLPSKRPELTDPVLVLSPLPSPSLLLSLYLRTLTPASRRGSCAPCRVPPPTIPTPSSHGISLPLPAVLAAPTAQPCFPGNNVSVSQTTMSFHLRRCPGALWDTAQRALCVAQGCELLALPRWSRQPQPPALSAPVLGCRLCNRQSALWCVPGALPASPPSPS